MMNEVYKELKKLKRVMVEWVDATDKSDVELNALKDSNINDLFPKRISLGWLVKDNKDGIIIVTDISEDFKCEFTAIPKNFKPKVRK